MKRVFRCSKCERTFDLAREIPKLQAAKGRLLTDAELAEAVDGSFHVCPGEPVLTVLEEEQAGPQVAATDYDWETGKPR